MFKKVIDFFKGREERNEALMVMKCETLYQFAKKQFEEEQKILNTVDIPAHIKARDYVVSLIKYDLVDEKFRLLWRRKRIA